MVSWKLYEEEWIKCNTDGASKGDPGQSTYGFYSKNNEGNLIYAEAHNIGVATNMEAKGMAIWKALQFFLIQGYQQETNALSWRNMLAHNWKILWELLEMLENIQGIMSQMNTTVKHNFREANQLADYIANLAIDKEEKQQFQHYNQIPSMGMKILSIDKHQIPSIRVKTRKIKIINYN
ncbi:uncharacterized protein [Solanum tuberosum]|uniref:uncharacterized protein n=1 Tax=Solanum tuberosum TaxID=4113 RepID=UPI00073A06CC|nr:PREDICTED: uncharacterized protein LOC107061285 [Solanum tuberosum]